MKKILSIFTASLSLLFMKANVALAQDDLFGINDLTNVNLGTRELEDTIAGIVNIALGFLGILAVLLILYGGYLWMTSGGNSDKVQRAKLLIMSALIGLVIILSAYAISRFILSQLFDVAGPAVTEEEEEEDPGDLIPCPDDGIMRICYVDPTEGGIGSYVKIIGRYFGSDAGEVRFVSLADGSSTVAELVTCGDDPIWGNTKVKVKVPEVDAPANYIIELYDADGNPSLEDFPPEFLVTAEPPGPNIACMRPAVDPPAPDWPRSPIGDLPLDIEIEGFGFTDTAGDLYMTGWDSGAGAIIDPLNLIVADWTDTLITAQIPDTALSSDVTVVVPAGMADDYFTVTCDSDTEEDCASGCCSGSQCRVLDICEAGDLSGPYIDYIAPADGNTGDLITIFGGNFGDNVGQVLFNYNEDVPVPGILSLPEPCDDTDNWHNNYIIVQVPAGVIDDDIVVIQNADIGGQESNTMFFDQTDTTPRPGICNLSPASGVYQDPITVEGLNFQDGDDAYFGAVLSYSTTADSTTQITAEMPNIIGEVGVSIHRDEIESNPYPFSALAVGSGDPVIYSIDPAPPEAARVGEMVTIMGANFGSMGPDSDVTFAGISGDFEFPPMCASGFWEDDRIVVKVPENPGGWTWGTHPVQVWRDEGEDPAIVSNPENINLEDGLPGPNLCYMEPDNGPAGTSLTLAGENFGTTAGNIEFQGGAVGTAGPSYSWDNTMVSDLLVPGAAETGLVRVLDSDGAPSNGMPYTVGSCPSVDEAGNAYCSDFSLGNLCCPGVAGNICITGASCEEVNSCNYGWDITADANPFRLLFNYNCENNLQSPSPWPDQWDGNPSTDAYTEIILRALFTRDIRDADINPTNFSVWRCGEGGLYDIFDCNPAAGGVEVAGTLTVINSGSDQEGIEFIPNEPLDQNYWYHISLGTFHAEVGDDIWMPSYEGATFDWHFRTRDSSNMCPVDAVLVSPQTPEADFYLGGFRNFYASPTAENCNSCNGSYNWDWDITYDPDGGDMYNYASMIPGETPARRGTARLDGLQITEPDHVTLQSTNNDFGAPVSDDTSPVIMSPSLKVKDYEPRCGNDACSNTMVWVDFNTTVIEEDITTDNFGIFWCDDASCDSYSPISLVTGLPTETGDDYFRVILDNPELVLDGTYIVIVDGDITNEYGYALNEDGEDFSYTFGIGHENCEFASAIVSPGYRLVGHTNPLWYYAYAYSDDGICGGAPLACDGCVYDWEDTSTDGGSVILSPGPDNSATARAQFEGTVNIDVDIESADDGISTPPGTAVMDILFSDPDDFMVIDHWPDCDGACLNSEIGVRFNHPVPDGEPFGAFRILNTDTGVFINDGTGGYTLSSGNTVLTLHHPDLEPGIRYDVLIGFNIEDEDGVWLGEDEFDNYTWHFTTGDEECYPNGVTLYPELLTLGASELYEDYEATPTFDSAECGEVPVDCPGCVYAWSCDPTIASFADPTVQTPMLTTTATVVTGDSTEVEVGIDGVVDTDTGLLTIEAEAAPDADDPFIHSIEPVDGDDDVCLNPAIVIQFSEPMDEESIDTNIALYGGTAVEDLVEGTWSFRLVDYDGSGDRETEAVFFPDDLLDPNTEHWVAVMPDTVYSTAGLSLHNGFPAPIILESTPFIPTVGWNFITSEETCTVHSVTIEPGPDIFTCSQRNDCDGDDERFITDNQHEYTAYSYDIEHNTLNSSLLDYQWSLDERSLAEGVLDLDREDEYQSIATPLVNYGTASLSTRVTGPDGSSAGDSAQIDVFVCQSPWPSITLYPWNEDDYNFSTFYCQFSGMPGDEIALPYLEYEPLPNPLYPNEEDPDILREYIFEVFNAVALAPGGLGSLAFEDQDIDQSQTDTRSWWKKLVSAFSVRSVEGQEDGGGEDGGAIAIDPRTIPPRPVNFIYTEVDEEHVAMTWEVSGGRNLDHMNLYRSVNGGPYELYEVLGRTARSYVDEEPVPFTTMTYRLVSYSDAGIATLAPALMQVFVSSDAPTDYIAIRVMKNDEHKSIKDWYNSKFPETAGQGQLSEVDGYEALTVGATTYIAAANITSSYIYTNVYIISHSIGSSENTINIYNQLIRNFKLSTNITTDTDNVCSGEESDISCVTDFDCTGYCNAQGLKLRRDTKRLGELVSIAKRLENYGINNEACQSNSNISCNDSSDCPAFSPCIPYYPLLESGAYLQGFSTSRWPISWTNTLSAELGSELPVDPVNLFNGCPDEAADPDTCWNESAIPAPPFICAENSLIYIYKAINNGQNYYLGANFEYDMYNPSAVGWDSLRPGWTEPATAYIDYQLEDCDGDVVNAPGSATSPYCGNGRIDSAYCTIFGITDPGECVMAGGLWIEQEECDVFDWEYGCSEEPPRQSDRWPHISSVAPGGVEWWNERPIGCNPPGSIDGDGNLIECTWHRPDPAYTAAQCGGYCGDGTIQPAFEGCEGSDFNGIYTCASGDGDPVCENGCQPICHGAIDYPAASCGDSVWSEGLEECDPTGIPDGTAGWDCSGGGIPRCNAGCQVYCTDGSEAYEGLCGDGVVTGVEECDYASFVPPIPAESSVDNTYGCTTSCTFTNEYCGDGELQEEYDELCDPTVTYDSPSTIESAEFRQYSCRDAGWYPDESSDPRYGRCTATQGGWCGDGITQNPLEVCDPGDPWASPPIPASYPDAPAIPADSSEDLQYTCNYNCLENTGGWCGDGDAQTTYGEICDGPDYPGRPTPDETVGGVLRYTCDMDDPVMKCRQYDPGGPYCGDGVPDYQYRETCDWDNTDPDYWPSPRGIGPLATQINQYQCINCENTGGWCGNGILDTWPGGGEECDTGFDPSRIIEKDVDLVYVFDMSASLLDEAEALCAATQDVVQTLYTEHPDINYRISIMVLGDNDDGFLEVDASDTGIVNSVTIDPSQAVALTPANHADDINYYYGESTWSDTTDYGNVPETSLNLHMSGGTWDQEGWVYKSKLVFRALVSNCPLYINNHDDDSGNDFDNVRYLSFYDNTTNDIYGTVERSPGGDLIGSYGLYPNCDDSHDFGGRIENWGYAINRIIDDYNWLPGYERVVIPISDEGAWCGGQTMENYEDYGFGGYTFPPDIPNSDILVRAVDHALSRDPIVHISPVLFTQPLLVSDIGPTVAHDTMSVFTNLTSGWAAHTIMTIDSTFCDGDGDGHMDCSLPDV